MGDWAITIEGTGVHHNGIEQDADAVAARTVQELLKAGHKIHSATFTSGARLALPVNPDQPGAS